MKSRYILALIAVAMAAYLLGAVSQRQDRPLSVAATATVSAVTETTVPETAPTARKEQERDYVANRNSHKFHLPSCPSVDQMLSSNRWNYHGTRSALIAQGYDPCQRCSP